MRDWMQRLQTELADRYQIERELGRGGMATVYLAQDDKHRRQVALKVMSPEISSALGPDRFLQEIEIAAGLVHPHILPLFDSGSAAGSLYYVTPYVEGDSLRALLLRDRQLPVEDAVRLAGEIASGLSYAHSRGIVHRDLKPENVLLSEGAAVIADFGIARALSGRSDAEATVTGIVLGTPRYMSPEQSAGSAHLDHRSDIYSLGCMLYEMLAGNPPFTGPDPVAVQAQHAADPVPPLRSRRPAVSEALEAIVRKALAKTPADRFPSAARMAEALQHATSGARTPGGAAPEVRVPTNLPAQRTSFIGRKSELAECARLLGETRLLTLTGVGGSGKTRLAIQLAASLLERFPDGVWFVDLAPLQDPERVLHAIAEVLAVKVDPGVPLLTKLGQEIGEKRALLLLDNCEHVLSACESLADALLAATPNLKILATSREGLGISGERLVAVRALALPKAKESPTASAIRNVEAVELFVERARAVLPSFSLTERNARAVAEICRRLDGVPLALELAAARVKLLSVEQIEEKLADRFRLLTGGSKTALPRHQTLRAAIQWSYDQLADDEKTLFTALSVFVGGWSLEAAAAVVDPGGDEFETLECLGRILDKSLLLVDRSEPSAPRYRMLETLRQYAQDRLQELGTGEALRARHFEHFAHWAAREEPHLRDIHWHESFFRLRPDLDNLRAALVWGFQNRPQEAAEMATSLGIFWDVSGLYAEGLEWLDRATASASDASVELKAKALRDTAMYLERLGRFSDAVPRYQESLALWRLRKEPRWTAIALRGLALTTYITGDSETARTYYEESLQICRGIGDRRGEAASLVQLGKLHIYLEDYETGLILCKEALRVRNELGGLDGIMVATGNIARAYVGLGDAENSFRFLRRCFEAIQDLQLPLSTASFLVPVAATLQIWGRHEEAIRFAAASQAIMRSIDARHEHNEQRLVERIEAKARSELDATAFERARRAGAELTWKEALREALRLQPGRA